MQRVFAFRLPSNADGAGVPVRYVVLRSHIVLLNPLRAASVLFELVQGKGRIEYGGCHGE